MDKDPAPTHRVVDVDDFEARIYLNSFVQENLKSSNVSVRSKARGSVCYLFRQFCITEYGDEWTREHDFVEWNDIASIRLL